MANVGKLNILVGASVGGLKNGLTGAAKIVSGFSSTVAKGLGGITGLLAGAGIVNGMQSAAEAIDKTAKAADRLGISTEELIGMQHAADLAGLSSEQLGMSLNKMLKSTGSASIEQLGEVADRIAAMDDPAKRAAEAIRIFGRSGMQMLPLLLEGSAGLAAARREAEALNISFSRTDAKKVEEANDSITKLKSSIKGSFQLFVSEIAGGVGGAAEQAAFKFAELARSGIAAFKMIRNEVAFFVGTWSLQWQLLKANSSLTWDTIKAGAVASFDSIVAGASVLGSNIAALFMNFVKVSKAAWDTVTTQFMNFFHNTSISLQNLAITGLATGLAISEALRAGARMDNPLAAFRDTFATVMKRIRTDFAVTDPTKTFTESITAQGGLKGMESVGTAMGTAFQDGFLKNLDPSLDVQKKKIESQIADVRKEFDAMQAGGAKSAEAKTAAASIEAKATAKEVSGKLASATQVGSTEAASQIFAAITGKQGKDDKIAANTERTATAAERTADALENLEMPEFDVVESF